MIVPRLKLEGSRLASIAHEGRLTVTGNRLTQATGKLITRDLPLHIFHARLKSQSLGRQGQCKQNCRVCSRKHASHLFNRRPDADAMNLSCLSHRRHETNLYPKRQLNQINWAKQHPDTAERHGWAV